MPLAGGKYCRACVCPGKGEPSFRVLLVAAIFQTCACARRGQWLWLGDGVPGGGMGMLAHLLAPQLVVVGIITMTTADRWDQGGGGGAGKGALMTGPPCKRKV